MSTRRTLVGAAAFSLALVGGGAVGSLLGSPSPSGAQNTTQDTTTTTTEEHATPPGLPGHRGESLAVAADALGISEADLRTSLEDGQSIAQVAATEGVDVQTVIDALVADATQRLEAAIDELPNRITALVDRTGLPDHGWPGGPRGGHGPRGEPGAQPDGSTDDATADNA